MRSDFDEIIAALPELKDISATTNGILLSKRAESLAESGLDRVNISLPSLNKEHYKKITGSSDALPCVLDGIDAAIDAGLTPIKLNMVLLKGINDSEIDDAINFSIRYDRNVILQLIELMNFKHVSHYMVDIDDIERMLESYGVEVELVRPIDNSCFCGNCNRLRITSCGQLKPCLMRNDNLIDISEYATDEEIRELLRKAVEIRELDCAQIVDSELSYYI